MIETHDAFSPGLPLPNDVVAARARGARRSAPASTAGLTVRTGGVMVRDRELRAFCRRLLGWAEGRATLVDDAVECLLTAVARGMPIALRGASDLVPVA